jgi:LysM repeat protein
MSNIRTSFLWLLVSSVLFGCQGLCLGNTNKTKAVVGPQKLKVLEQKAIDRDLLIKRCEQLENELVEASLSSSRAAQVEKSPTSLPVPSKDVRKLDELERKAAAYDLLTIEVSKKDTALASVTAALDQAKAQAHELETQIETMQKQIDELNASRDKSLDAEKGLRNTIEELLLGNFEYYEVKKGDTLASIAAQATVYSDESKKGWLRQANRHRVKDPDNLDPDEVLVIPRFPPNGRYEF